MALPLPKVVSDVGPGGGIVTSMGGQNAVTRSALDNMTAGAQAQYAPYNSYADVMLKKAQAQAALPQAIATIANSPAASQMTGNQFQNLMNQFQNSLSGVGSSWDVPVPNQGSWLQRRFAQPQMQPQAQNQNSNQDNNQSNTFSQPMPQQQSVNNPFSGAVASAAQGNQPLIPNGTPPVNNSFGYNTPAAAQEQQTRTPGAIGPNTPVSTAVAQQEANKTAAVGQAASQNAMKEARSKTLSQQSLVATNALKSLEGFHRNYKGSSYKGQYLGNQPTSGPGSIPTLPGHTNSPEQLSGRYANQFLTDLSGLGDTPAGQTDLGRGMIAAGKPDLSLEEGAENEIYDSYKAKLQRIIQLRDFATNFYKNNPSATDEQLVGMMNAYNEYAPPYDYEKGKPLSENNKKMKDFTSPDALNSYVQNGYYNPYATGNIEDTRQVNGQTAVKIKGVWYWRK